MVLLIDELLKSELISSDDDAIVVVAVVVFDGNDGFVVDRDDDWLVIGTGPQIERDFVNSDGVGSLGALTPSPFFLTNPGRHFLYLNSFSKWFVLFSWGSTCYIVHDVQVFMVSVNHDQRIR